MADGVIRMAMFFTFLFLLSLMPDMRVCSSITARNISGVQLRIGQAGERGKRAEIRDVPSALRTSFLFVVLGIAMITYALLPIDGFWMKFVARIALLPVIAGVSYEVIRFAARRQGTLMSVLTMPGLWLQEDHHSSRTIRRQPWRSTLWKGAMALEAKQGGELVIA